MEHDICHYHFLNKNHQWTMRNPHSPKEFLQITTKGQGVIWQSEGNLLVKKRRRAVGLKLCNMEGLCEEQLTKGFYRKWGGLLKNVEFDEISRGLLLHGVKRWWKGIPHCSVKASVGSVSNESKVKRLSLCRQVQLLLQHLWVDDDPHVFVWVPQGHSLPFHMKMSRESHSWDPKGRWVY